jgi:hypothetical protein
MCYFPTLKSLLLQLGADFVGYMFPDFAFSWLVPEIRNAVMVELDFTNEARCTNLYSLHPIYIVHATFTLCYVALRYITLQYIIVFLIRFARMSAFNLRKNPQFYVPAMLTHLSTGQCCHSVVTVLLQWCHSGFTDCHNGVTVVSQWFHRGGTMVAQ